ncbi:TPA: hypothetical protein ACP61A_004552, partial [Escherichia coli]
RVEEAATPVSPEAASPSVASAAPQSVQQAPQADQNGTEQATASAGQEVTGTESKKTNELPMGKTLEEQRKELQREIEEKRANLKKAKHGFMLRHGLRNNLSGTEKSISDLEEKLQSFTEATSEEKQKIATSLKEQIEQDYWVCKNECDLINAKDLGDFLFQMLIEGKIKDVHLSYTDPLTNYLAYKFGSELSNLLRLEDKETKKRVYSNNTEITVSCEIKYQYKYTKIDIKDQRKNGSFNLPMKDLRFEVLERIASRINCNNTEYQTDVQTTLHKLESELDAFAGDPEKAYREHYERALLFKEEQRQRLAQKLSIAESEGQKITEIKTQLNVLEGKLASLEKINQN